jgi:exosortase
MPLHALPFLAHTSSSTRRSTWRKIERLLFAALVASSLLVAWHPLVSTLALAARIDEYTHILLIVPISLAFIWAGWTSAQTLVAPGFGYGSVLLFGAALIAVFSSLHFSWITADARLSIEMLALVTWWIGSFVLCFGARASRAFIFPLLFLFWMVPLPSIVLNEIIGYLQHGSSITARFFFDMARVPVAQNGVMLTIPGLTVEIAKECSSIRSSLLLLITTMVVAQFSLRMPLSKALVIAIAVPLSVAKNGLRIFTLAMLATRVDPEFLTGRLHRQGGVVFYAISLLFMFGIIGLMRRREELAQAASALVPAG